LGTEERMRVPSPAASTMVRLDRAVIPFLCESLANPSAVAKPAPPPS
jgi:hypothetical protein